MKARLPLLALLAVICLLTGCAANLGVTETPSASGLAQPVSTAADATEAETQTTAAPETNGAPETTAEAETTTAPETTTVPETTEMEPYLSTNEAGKLVVHCSVPNDDRPAYAYTFNPHAFFSLYTMVYGEAVAEEICGFCDAVLAGEDSFPCTGRENWVLISDIKNTLLPVCFYVDIGVWGDGFNPERLQDGRYPLFYNEVSKQEFLSIVADFKERVAFLIAQADLREGDSDLEKAMKLYTATSLRIRYDTDAASDNNPRATTAYHAIMHDEGICQEIAPAYSYLLLQAGVDAGVCFGTTKDGQAAHMWSLVNLDGTWYHADPTFQGSHSPYALQFFLTPDAERDQRTFDLEGLQIGEFNVLSHKDLPMDDTRYAALWDVCWYAIDHEAGTIEYYDDSTLDYSDPTVYKQARKTLPLP